MEYKQAEGGASDEAAIVRLLTSTSPPWGVTRIRDQARWGVVQAALILTEHRAAFEALVEALSREAPLGECVQALELALAPQLPGPQASILIRI